MPTLLLVDGHSQAYRAYFGVKTPLTTRRGELTTAVYGFARKLLSVLKEYQPEYAAVAFDVGDTWRHTEFPDYKATRERMPDDMQSQMERIEQMLAAMHIPTVSKEGYEADDVIGALAKQAAEQGFDVLVLTGDRDMFQLVDDRVRILYTRGGPNPKTDVYGPEEFKARYGLTTEQYIDMKALVGDASDNIPGVPGIGEKTAIKLLKTYGSLDNLYAHIDEIRGPKTQQALRDAAETVRRNRELVRIITDLDIPFEPEQFRLQGIDRSALRRLFEELEFFSLLREIEDAASQPVEREDGQLSLFGDEVQEQPAAVENPYQVIENVDALAALLDTLAAAPLISFDVETTATDPMQADLVGLGVA
ncbi:MAG: DNA polymerase I, partial [Caldilineae bacterium]